MEEEPDQQGGNGDDPRLDYFNDCGDGGPREPVLSGSAAWSIFLALIAAAVGIAAGLARLNPYSRPAASLVIGLAALAAMFFGGRALVSRDGGHVERSVSVCAIALGALCIVGAVLIMVRR